MARRILSLTLALGVLVALTACGSQGPTTPDGDTQRILGVKFPVPVCSLIAYSRVLPTSDSPYSSNRELFLMFPNGAYQSRLTWDPADDDYPAFSPGGHALAFTSTRSGWHHDVFRMNAIGSVFQLTDESWEFDSTATDWAPGFITCAQLNTLIMAPFDVVRVQAISPWGNWEKTVNTGHIANYDPCMSRDGKMLCFAARPSGAGYWGSLELYLWRKGWPEPIQLTHFGNDDIGYEGFVYTRHPAFDFQGRRIVFQTILWDGNWEIGYIKLDIATDLAPVRVTYNGADDVHPCWDPTGRWIAFATDRDGNFEIYKIWAPPNTNPVTTPPVRLTYTMDDEANPDWSPFYGPVY